MAAKKAPMRKPVAKKPVAKKPAAKKAAANKSGSAAQLRMREERDRKNMAGRSKPTRTLTRAQSIAMGKGMANSKRRDVYGESGFGNDEVNIYENYDRNVEAVGRSALKNISGKKPVKGEPLNGSETQIARSQALKGLGLSGAQVRYVEDMMSRVPYRPKRRSR